MEDWKKITQVILVLGVLAVGLRVYFIYRERHEPMVVKKAADTGGYQPTVDDYTYLKQMHPEAPKDLLPLVGQTVWANIADQLPYFPVSGKTVNYSKQVGVLRGATPLAVKGVLTQAVPHSLVTRVPNGEKQVLLAFTLPASATQVYAVPVGYQQAGSWTFIADQALFYDDPHRLYSWSPKIWQAIESHQAIVGMTEQQAGLALGQVQQSDSTTFGDRTVHFDNLGHPVDVTFVKNHATAVTPVKP
jgi:hypothetical protein